MRALLFVAMAAFFMIPPSFAQTSESLLTQPEPTSAPAVSEQAVEPVAQTPPTVSSKAIKTVKKEVKKAHKKHSKATKKALKKTTKKHACKKTTKKAAKASAPKRNYVYSPRVVKKAPKQQEYVYLPPEQEETVSFVEEGNVVQAGGASAPLYSSTGSLVTFGQ